jgi:tripartite-type tricarboxylate transporter receptor subunit TctC
MPENRGNTMMRMPKLMLALVLAVSCAQAPAQAYPVKPIRLVVGFAPGGAW